MKKKQTPRGIAALSPEERIANAKQAQAISYAATHPPAWDWAAEMPRLRANVRADVERIKAEPVQ